MVFHTTECYIAMMVASLPMLASLYYYSIKKNHTMAVFLLLLSGFLLRLAFATFDPFLHDWDERFHALVAKNMMEHPFRPMLRLHPILPYDPAAWCCNHIWLHKQPLFLWQMAIAMKVFGVSEWAIRIPAVVMGTVSLYMVYDVARLWVKRTDVAYWAALMLAFSYWQLEMTSGRYPLEQNDVAFGFYVTASIWAYVRYLHRPHPIRWAVLVGVFVGAAVLIKWLTGILVLGGWGLYILCKKTYRTNLKRWWHLGLAAVVSLLVFMPWQWYIMQAFPVESAISYAHNQKHIFEAVEGHKGTAWFHLEKVAQLYSPLLWVFIPVGIVQLYRDKNIALPLSISLTAMVTVVYLFFSLIVATKMRAFTYPVHAIMWIWAAMGVASVWSYVSKKYAKYLFPIAAIIIAIINLRPVDVAQYRGLQHAYRNDKIRVTQSFKNWDASGELADRVILNCNQFRTVELMFYQDVNAFQWYPSEARLDSLQREGYQFAVFPHADGHPLPDYILEDDAIMIIQNQD